jgi:NAD(P)-dependent dehydrogenase (short-subunit alcohol dehydrogenase family)
VINIASLLSFQGGIRVPSYTAAKSGLAGLTKILANEWATKGINVNAIAPGYFDTNNTEALRADADRNASILARIPAGRWGRRATWAAPPCSWPRRPPTTSIVDRIGAGDAFAAGILHGLLIGQSIEDAANTGLALTALKHSLPGDASLFTQDDIIAFQQDGLDVRR